MGKGEISASAGKTGNYNKRAIPFSLDNEVHVAGLAAICNSFADPWNTGRAYSRGDLATDVSQFHIAVEKGDIVPIPRSLFQAAVAPFLAEQEAAAKAAEKAKAPDKKKKTK